MPFDFQTAIHREIADITTRLGITENKAFLYWFATQILEIEEDAALAETLGNDKEKVNFWAYNNGVTVICDSFKEGKKSVELRNFSIVNGCQTTVSLSEHNGSLADVSVLVRCIASSSSILDSIIRFTNSQNPIRTWDIASQDKTQRRLRPHHNYGNNLQTYGHRPDDLRSGHHRGGNQ